MIKTKLNVSGTHGIGLFADQFIAEGTVIWKFNRLIDMRCSEEEIEQLSETSREQVQKYSYREKHSGLYVLCGDDARFFNHSEHPNCLDYYHDRHQDITVARRNITPGEELTCDYASFDLDWAEGKYQFPHLEKSDLSAQYFT